MSLERELQKEGIKSLDELDELWSSWTSGRFWGSAATIYGPVISCMAYKPPLDGAMWEYLHHAVAVPDHRKHRPGTLREFKDLAGMVNRARLVPALIDEIRRLRSALETIAYDDGCCGAKAFEYKLIASKALTTVQEITE